MNMRELFYNSFVHKTSGISKFRRQKMKTVGLICEFNPLHTGHASLLRQIRQSCGEDCAVVCAMSGDYIQRGEPALFARSVRAEAAAACGADLVLELPVPRVLSSAEGFARGGVEILNRVGADVLAFGCECGDGAALMAAARQMRSPAFEERTKVCLKQGSSYAAARQSAMEELGGRADLLRSPNDILALEYCRAMLDLGEMELFAVRRPGDYHAAAAEVDAPSATAVRKLFFTGGWEPFVPAEAREIFAPAPRHAMEFGQRAVLARLRAMTDDQWERTAHGSEGLWRKVRKAVRETGDLNGILTSAKSKRYPMTRLKRLILCAYLGITDEDLKRPVDGCRILALSQRGREVVRQCRSRGDLALYQPGDRTPDEEFRRRCSDLYGLFCERLDADLPGRERHGRIFFGKE